MHTVRSPQLPSHVVGIGASAGGLDALERFFGNVPRESGAAYVVIQHLSPDFKSLMDELLARHTQLPIRLVEDGMLVERDHVYLIPPKKEMIISGGKLLLSEQDRRQELSLPIDMFFRSLAQDCGPQAVAIVLSGGGSDGSRGVRDVHEAGGLVMVQDTDTAQFDGMPRTARDAGVAHWVLPPQAMPAVLLDHIQGRGHSQSLATAEAIPAIPQGISVVYRMLQEEYGIDFTHYKPSTVTRRIERRLALNHSQNIEEYIERLRQDRDEFDVLYRDLLIGVTRFFRDEAAFELLEQRVLPELLQRAPRETPLRVWVAGCATGEEAYSLAIVLQDLMLRLGDRPVKIFATDVHRGSLERAAAGIYDEDAVKGVSRERLERYFLRVGNTYQVVPDLRQMVVFAAHNVIKDPPFTRVHLISCRNLLIYLQPSAQHKVLSLFHFALNRGGALVLGPSESAGALGHDFESVDKRWQVYRKHTDARMSVEPRSPAGTASEGRTSVAAPVAPVARYSLSQLLGTYDTLLDEFMPPSLLVTERGELVHAFSGASRFLHLRDGRQGLDVLDVVDSQLKMVLVGGLKRALSEPGAIVFKGVRAGPDGAAGLHKITIRRVRSRTSTVAHMLISFEPMEAPAPPPTVPETEIDLGEVSREQLAALETELSHAKENLQAAIEELQASNEELQASNEELQASNEELQSTNEELQSVNEELYTVNAEYQRKITELTELTNDMDNLLSSTEVGTIFLDGQLRIRKFTPQIAETFSLVVHDVGRPIETFAHKMDHPELVDDLKRVLASRQPVERELDDVRGRSFFLRILPYRVRGTVDGVVLTLIDVSALKRAEDELFHERYLLNSLMHSLPDAIYFKDTRGRYIRANRAMALRLKVSDPKEAVGKTAFELPDQAGALALHQHDEEVLRTGEAQLYRIERRSDGEGGDAWDMATRVPLRDGATAIVGIIGICRDVTAMKRAEERVQEAVRRRDQFLAMLSHELRNPLGAIVTATALLKGTSSGPSRNPGRLLEVLDRQSRQMARLLDDLLEASRVTQNKIELKKRVIDLRTVLRDAVDAVRAQLDARSLALALELPAEPLLVYGDPARLQQIQANLLSNSVKYTPPGGRIEIRAVREGARVVLRVRDDGAGIGPDMIDSVFELFVQSHRTLDRAAGGLGVGLTLVRSLVEMHGGTVQAQSDGEGKGSEFVVRLPVATDATVEDLSAPRPRPQLPEGARVVVVEDNADSRETLCEVLTLAGYECKSVDNGAGALTLIDDFKPDIVVLDVGLPEMDGFEIARRLRSDPRYAHLCIIALTGYGQNADRAASREAGFDHHLVKPAQPDQLLQVLSEMRHSGVAPRRSEGSGSESSGERVVEESAG